MHATSRSQRRDTELRERYGSWALITGASAGIGAQFARRLAGKGLNTILVARRQPLLDALASEIQRDHGVEATTLAVDLSEPGFLDTLDAATRELDVGLLVNNAGTTYGGAFLETDPSRHQREVHLNILAPLLLSHHLGRRMLERGRGGIIFVSSLFALQGVPNFANYAATKSYDLTLGDGLAHELGDRGIDVLTVAPGPTLTEGTERMGASTDSGPMPFRAPDLVVTATLRSLGRRSTVVPGGMNRVMTAFTARSMSRSSRTRMWAAVLKRMEMTDVVVSSPQADGPPERVDSAAAGQTP
jgi:uncharacterized protein